MKNNQFDLKVRIKQSLDALHMFQKAEHIPELVTLAAYVCFMDVDFARSLEKLSKTKVKDEIKQFLRETDLKFIDALVTEKLDEVEFSIILRAFIEAFASYGNAEDYGKAVAQVLAEVLADEFNYEFFINLRTHPLTDACRTLGSTGNQSDSGGYGYRRIGTSDCLRRTYIPVSGRA